MSEKSKTWVWQDGERKCFQDMSLEEREDFWNNLERKANMANWKDVLNTTMVLGALFMFFSMPLIIFSLVGVTWMMAVFGVGLYVVAVGVLIQLFDTPENSE